MVPDPDLTGDHRPGEDVSGPVPPPPPAATPQWSNHVHPALPSGYPEPVGYPEPASLMGPDGTPGYVGYPPPMIADPKPEPLPVEPREYHQFYRAPAFRWWKPLAAVALFAVGWFMVSIPPTMIAVFWELSQGRPMNLENLNTPAFFAANDVSLALAIPVALLVHWLIYRQRPRWLSSITGGFRWGFFGRSVGIAAIGLLALLGIQTALAGGVGDLTWDGNSLFLLLVIVFTTPFQAAGEEYAMRGLVFRSVSSWFSNRWVALGIGITVNAVFFMLLHGAGDPWLISYYLLVAVVFSVLVWRTGGLEAAIAMHVVNNLIGELTLPFQPEAFAQLFDRQAGTAGPEVLIQMGITVLVAAALLWQASRLKLPRANAPAALAQPQAPSGLV